MNANDGLERRLADHYATAAPRRAPDSIISAALETIDAAQQRRPIVRVPRNLPSRWVYASVVVVAVVVAGLAIGPGDALRRSDVPPAGAVPPLTWSPDRLAQDWPVPIAQEPARGSAVSQLIVGNDATWDAGEGLWEPLEYGDATGDVAPGAGGWVDITEVRLSLGAPTVFGLVLVDDIPSPAPSPTDQWIAYGVVLDTNGDGAPDVRIGIDNMPTGEHRAWRTDLATGLTLAKAGPPYGVVGEGRGGTGGTGRGGVGLDTYYPGDADVGANASLRYSLQEGEEAFRFYAWASVIQAGRVVAVDYAPDTGWLEEGPQPKMTLGGPAWRLEEELPGYVASGGGDSQLTVVEGPITIVATLTFTGDGRINVDTGCSTGVGTVMLEPAAIRIRDLRLSEPGCRRTDTAAFDAATRAFLSADELTYTIDQGVLEFRAGEEVRRFAAAFDEP